MIETSNDNPTPDQIRAAVERMTVSDAFARSPQLAAFLRFVVEAVLHGKADRIKAYTIGVEVLRRDPKFDPQLDPIVRVEATRLRRTIERYYSGPGADEPLILDLPRGSYVPTFRWREPGVQVAAIEPEPKLPAGWRGFVRSRFGVSALTAAVLLLTFGAGAALLMRLPVQQMETTGTTRELARPVTAAMLPPGNGMPSIYIESMRTTGVPADRSLSVDMLTEKIGDAFARFDTINVVYAPRTATTDTPIPEPRSDYRLSGAIEYNSDDASVQFRLIDVTEGSVVWSRSFDRIAPADQGVAEERIVFALTDSLLQSYGVIRSRDRAKQLTSATTGDPRYRCVLEAADSIRTLIAAEQQRAMACLDNLTAVDPSFALGYTFLAILYGREYQLGITQPGAEPVLDRALRAVRRSIELNPASSRTWTVLMVVLFHRQEVPEAFAAGDKALALNKYDMLAPAEYGGRLIMVGETERGLAMMRRAAGTNVVRPSWQHFYLFLGAYLGGDMKDAAYQAGQITENNYALGHLARALVASAMDDAERARQAIERLVAVQPGWRTSPRLELMKLSPNPLVVDRLAKDMAKAGLPGS